MYISFPPKYMEMAINSKHGIHCDERQTLMDLVRKLVYAKTEAEFTIEYHNFQNHVLVKK